MKNKQKQYKKAMNSLQQEFIEYVRNYNGAFTCLNDISRWMSGFKEFDDVNGAEEFQNIMRKHEDFEDRDFYKIGRAYRKFLEDKIIESTMNNSTNEPNYP